jgi:UDPglucose 6-dehydrogenase
MIGIIGYGMVGQAVHNGFNKAHCVYSDPAVNTVTVEAVCAQHPKAIFVCVPTPTDDTNYETLRGVLQQIKNTGYQGLTVVKSTVLPHYIEEFDVLYNPEFLSRATANEDFLNPPFVLIGGQRAHELVEVYRDMSSVNLSKVITTDVKTAALAKYVMNSFYATKVTFMNEMYNVAEQLGVNWSDITGILKNQPWMGTHHFDVPGPDGQRGFGGPCLPKDTEALVKHFDTPLLQTVLLINKVLRQ